MSIYTYNEIWNPIYQSASIDVNINNALRVNGNDLNTYTVSQSLNSNYATTANYAYSAGNTVSSSYSFAASTS